MSYLDSIRQVNIADGLLLAAIRRGDDVGGFDGLLDKFECAHRRHLNLFGSIARVDGEWV